MKVGISFLGRLKARANRENEIPHWNFNKIVDQAKKEWNNVLAEMIDENTDKIWDRSVIK